MTKLDIMVLALMGWKENRGGRTPGMQSCMNVAINRSIKEHKSIYAIVFAPFQFSSMSYHNDPELLIQAEETDVDWIIAQNLAQKASQNLLLDITDGATAYYAETIPEPDWAKKMTKTCVIAGQIFFK